MRASYYDRKTNRFQVKQKPGAFWRKWTWQLQLAVMLVGFIVGVIAVSLWIRGLEGFEFLGSK